MLTQMLQYPRAFERLGPGPWALGPGTACKCFLSHHLVETLALRPAHHRFKQAVGRYSYSTAARLAAVEAPRESCCYPASSMTLTSLRAAGTAWLLAVVAWAMCGRANAQALAIVGPVCLMWSWLQRTLVQHAQYQCYGLASGALRLNVRSRRGLVVSRTSLGSQLNRIVHEAVARQPATELRNLERNIPSRFQPWCDGRRPATAIPSHRRRRRRRRSPVQPSPRAARGACPRCCLASRPAC